MAAFRYFATCALFVGLAGGANASVLYDNSGAANTTPYGLDEASGYQGDQFAATSNTTLSTVSLMLDNGGSPVSGSVVEVDIYTDSGNAPNGLLATLGDINESALSATPQMIGFTNVGVSVVAGQKYWVTMTDENYDGINDTSNVEWSFNSDLTSPDSGAGVAGLNNLYGSTIAPNDISGSGPFIMCVDDSGRECRVDQNAFATPEPAGVTILGLALAGLGLVRRRRSA